MHVFGGKLSFLYWAFILYTFYYVGHLLHRFPGRPSALEFVCLGFLKLFHYYLQFWLALWVNLILPMVGTRSSLFPTLLIHTFCLFICFLELNTVNIKIERIPTPLPLRLLSFFVGCFYWVKVFLEFLDVLLELLIPMVGWRFDFVCHVK